MSYERLTRPLKVGGITLKNRMLSAPTSLAELGPDEHYSQDNFQYYKLKAAGGCALVTVGDVIVDNKTGRSHPQQVGLDDPGCIPYLSKMADAIHSGGAMASCEIDHGGALSSPELIDREHAFGPSGYIDDWGDQVDEMTYEDMEMVANAFADGAALLKDIGYDMVMLHMGHGWLLHQFISPLTNFRTDEYGGSLENRMRFPLMVVDRVRKAVGRSFPIDVRISGSERVEGGYDIDTGVEIAKMLDGKVDLIHVSAGTQQDEYSAVLMHPGVFQKHGENSYLAAEIKKHVKTPVCTVGAFSEPDKMEVFLEESDVDCIAMGRALIADPFLPRKVIRNQVDQIRPCIRCGECQSGMMKTGFIRCTVNPYIGREDDYFHPIPTREKRRVLIVGGGPAGMESAIEAYESGHDVVLCESSGKLGGTLYYADGADFKRFMKNYRDSQVRKVLALPIDLRLNTRVDAALVKEIGPDVLILATGAKPLILPVPGIKEGIADGSILFGADITDHTPLGDKVVVIGGGLIGCETAVHTGRMGHDTTVIEMREDVAVDCGRMHRLNLLHQMEVCDQVHIAAGYACSGVTAEGVYAKEVSTGEEKLFPADSVILAAGMVSDTATVDALRETVPECYVIGDAMRARKVGNATRDAYDAVVNMGLC